MKSAGNIFFILLLCCLLQYNQAFSQNGIPFIRNYLPKEYRGHGQIFTICQDNRGVMYFGNTPGIVEYDGTSWRYIFITDRYVTVRALKKGPDGKIYVGTEKEFGYLSPDTAGVIKYHSLLPLVNEKEREFTEVWTIHVLKKEIYFCSNEKIFIYNPDSSRIAVIHPETSFKLVFNAGESFFSVQDNIGLTEIRNGIKHFVPGIGKNEIIAGAYEYSSDTILLIISNRLYLYSGGRLTAFKSAAGDFLLENHAYRGLKLSISTWSINTLNKGIVIIDKHGRILNIYNKNIGLNSETVLSQFPDADGTLWLGTENGISKIEINNPIKEYDIRNGLPNTINTVYCNENEVYAGTSTGVYYLKRGEGGILDEFVPIEPIKWQVFDMTFAAGTPLLATGHGVYCIKNNTAQPVVPELGLITGCVMKSEKFPNLVYAGGFHYCHVFEFSGNKWLHKGKLEGVTFDIHTIAETKEGDLWMGTYSEGLVKVVFSGQFSLNPQVKTYNENNGLPPGWVQALKMDGRLLFGTAKGLFIYDADSDGFYPDTSLARELSDGRHEVVRILRDDSLVFVLTNGNVAFIRKNKYDNGNLVTMPFLRNEKEEFYGIDKDGSGYIWAGGPAGVISYSVSNKKNYSRSFSTLIRLVTAGKDTLFHGTLFNDNISDKTFGAEKKAINILYADNTLYFEFSACTYEDESANRYIFQLEGFDKEWSPLTADYKKQYTNLPEGKYQFRVKGINKYHVEGAEAAYQFYILPPWYRTGWAYGGYVLLFLVVMYGAIQISILRLQAAKKRLEKIVKERTAEIVQKNIQLEKLSIVARETDNGVLIADAGGEIEWVNEGFIRMHGFDLNGFIRNRGNNLLKASANPEISRIIQESIEQKKSVIYESINTAKDGKSFWVQSTLTPILDEGGSIRKLVVIDADITHRKKQEEIIAQQNKEIIDSIEYASYIQRSVLPSDEEIHALLPESFIIFKPRDIVSGDFYWVAHPQPLPKGGALKVLPLGENLGGAFLLCLADCTGHGVPGAFMSMLCTALLREAVHDKHIFSPEAIFEEVRKGIIEALKQRGKGGEAMDGMDGTLISLQFRNVERRPDSYRDATSLHNQNGMVLQAACANNPVYVVSNGKLSIYKADRFPVGIYPGELKPFTLQTLEVQNGDMIYLLSDGYASQLGGIKGRKYQSTQLEELLVSISGKPLPEQKESLLKLHEEWKGREEQTDDVTVIGIRI